MKTTILDVPNYARFLEANHKKSIQCKDSAWHGFTALIMDGERYILGATEEEVKEIDNRSLKNNHY